MTSRRKSLKVDRTFLIRILPHLVGQLSIFGFKLMSKINLQDQRQEIAFVIGFGALRQQTTIASCLLQIVDTDKKGIYFV